MGITFNQLQFKKSSPGGGRPAFVINSGEISSVFAEISATQRESGGTFRTKLFMTNTSSDRKMLDTIIYLAQGLSLPDRLTLFPAAEKTDISFKNTSALSSVVAGTTIEISSITENGISVAAGALAGRKFIHGLVEYTITDAPSDVLIKLDKDITAPIDTIFVGCDKYDSIESNSDFSNANANVVTPSRSLFQQGSMEVSISASLADFFAVSDNVLVLDGYHRAVSRASVSSIANNSSDTTVKILNLNKSYMGSITVPNGSGFVANGFKRTILPGETVSFWLQLDVSPESNVTAEVVNQFQIGLHFDDIAV